MRILKSALNYGGRLYQAGEPVDGRLDAAMIAVLEASGELEELEPVAEAVEPPAEVTGDPKPPAAGDADKSRRKPKADE